MSEKNVGASQALELEFDQHVFMATLPLDQGALPTIVPGSRVKVTGVFDNESASAPTAAKNPPEKQSLAGLTVLLRAPEDVAVISGPPWWTLRRTASLEALATALAVALLLGAFAPKLRPRTPAGGAAGLFQAKSFPDKRTSGVPDCTANLHDGFDKISW